MQIEKTHLQNIQGKTIKHWIIEVADTSLTISSGRDLNNLKSKTTKYENTSEAHVQFTKNIWKQMAKGYIYRNTDTNPMFGDIILHLRS